MMRCWRMGRTSQCSCKHPAVTKRKLQPSNLCRSWSWCTSATCSAACCPPTVCASWRTRWAGALIGWRCPQPPLCRHTAMEAYAAFARVCCCLQIALPLCVPCEVLCQALPAACCTGGWPLLAAWRAGWRPGSARLLPVPAAPHNRRPGPGLRLAGGIGPQDAGPHLKRLPVGQVGCCTVGLGHQVVSRAVRWSQPRVWKFHDLLAGSTKHQWR